MRNWMIFLMAVGLLFACSTSKQLPNAAKGVWMRVEAQDGSVPAKRHEAAFVGLEDQFYLLGGRRMNPVSIYDATTATWTNASVPPIEMHHFQPVVYKDKIYIMGAFTGGYPDETPIPNIYSYDPATDQWTKGAEIPADRLRGGAGVALYKGKFYLACGIKDGHRGDHKKWLDVYDPKTDSWEQLPDAPRARDHFQAVVADDKLYLLGGRTTVAADNPFKNTITAVDVFDFKTKQWSTLPNDLPTPRAGNYATLYGKDILVMGGESFHQELAHNEVEALNVKTQTWRTLSPMLEGRHGTGIVIYNNKFYVASGCGNRGGSPELTTMECLGF